jgi:hypothetical protein
MIEPSTITRGITYLYRWWIQQEFGVVPETYIRREGQATVVCPNWALIGSGQCLDSDEIHGLKADLNRAVYAICPDLVDCCPGFDLSTQASRDLTGELQRVVEILAERQGILSRLGEEDAAQKEWYHTTDAGEFKLWKRNSRRLLLYPTGQSCYGFTIGDAAGGGDFFFRSRSCREEGQVVKQGIYKMSEHAKPSGGKVHNLDLLFSDGTVLLLSLRSVGAGYKVFPRRVLGHEGSLD